MRDIIIYVAPWWEKYLSKRSLIKLTCSWHDKLIILSKHVTCQKWQCRGKRVFQMLDLEKKQSAKSWWKRLWNRISSYTTWVARTCWWKDRQNILWSFGIFKTSGQSNHKRYAKIGRERKHLFLFSCKGKIMTPEWRANYGTMSRHQ